MKRERKRRENLYEEKSDSPGDTTFVQERGDLGEECEETEQGKSSVRHFDKENRSQTLEGLRV